MVSIVIMRKSFLGGIVMKQLKRKLWLKRGMIAGLTLATCTSFAVGALSWNLNSDKAYAAGGTVVSDFTATDTTVTSAPAWKNGVNNNWVTPENLDTGLYYYDYTLKDVYGGKAMEFVADPDDASDTVLKYWTGKSGIYLTQFTFAEPLAVQNIGAITLRLYARVDTDNASKIQIFPSEVQNNDSVDAYSYSYYEYPLTVQNQWVELTINGDDLAKITDDTFEGFVVRIQMSANAYPRDARNGAEAMQQSGYILFDSVTAQEKTADYTVTFDYDKAVSGMDTVTQKVTVAPYTVTKPENPAVFGKKFEGWYTQEGDLFDFTKGISSDITLKAKYSEYTLADKVLTDGTANSLQYGTRTLVNSNSNGWTNDAVGDKRLAWDEKGLRMYTHVDAYFGYYAKTLKEVAVETVDSLTFKLYINAFGANANAIDIFAGDAEARYGEKLSFKYADCMKGTEGEVLIKLTQEQLATIAIDGKFSSFNLFVQATGYDTTAVDSTAPYLTLDEITYTTPLEITDYSAIAGEYYGNDGKKLVLNADKTATYAGENGSFVLYQSGALKVKIGDTTYNGIFENGNYSINGVTYYKYNNEQLASNMLTDFAPWNVSVGEKGFINSDDNGWTNSFYDLKNPPSFVQSSEYVGKFAVKLYNGGISAVPVCKVTFKNKVSLASVGSITIRMYIHVGEATASYLRVYASDEVARNSANYCELKFNAAQASGYGWYDFTIQGDDLAKIADANGEIAGMHVLLSLTDSVTQASDAQVILDSVSYKLARKVTFTVDNASDTVKVVDGEKAVMPENPVKEGYYFVGWYNGDVAYDFDTAVTSDIVLTAKFMKFVNDYTPVLGAYTGANGTVLSLNEEGVAFLTTGNGVEVCEYALTEGNILVVKTANGTYSFDKDSVSIAGEAFTKADCVKVHYQVDGESTTVRMPKNAKAIVIEIPAKDGYTIVGWYNGDVAYDFQTALTEEITLTAKYGYVEISDYTAYMQTYYDEASKTMFIFGANNEVKMIVNGVETTYTYYVLDGAEKDIWIIVNDGVETAVADNTVAISVDNVSYKKLKSYTVTFVNGQSREETTVNGGYYKVEEPEKPTKLGYNFEGWYEAGSATAFDFSKVITGNIELTAKWTAILPDPVEPTDSTNSTSSVSMGCGSTVSALSIGAVTLLVGAVALCRKGKKEE